MHRQLLYMGKYTFSIFLVFLLFFSCNSKEKRAAEIAKISVDLDLDRFDRAFAAADSTALPDLRKRYPYLFPAPDSVWIAKMNDSLQRELFEEVGKTFSSFGDEEAELIQLFQHLKYYFPEFETPKVITVTNDVDYANRIIYADTLLFVGLDNYLGSEHRYYGGFQRYVAKVLDRKYLTSDVVSALSKKMVPRPLDRTFLARMVYFGKELYLKDVLMPSVEDAVKIRYTDEELAWAKANAEPMWRNFIENEYLYSTDRGLTPGSWTPRPSPNLVWSWIMSPLEGWEGMWDGKSYGPLWKTTMWR